MALGQRLFPDQDVAALDLARRVVVGHHARQVQAHGHELIAVPADVADVLAGRGPHLSARTRTVVAARASDRSTTRTAAPRRAGGCRPPRAAGARSGGLRAARSSRWPRARPACRRGRARPGDRGARSDRAAASTPRSATSAGTDALTYTVAEPSSARKISSSYSYFLAMTLPQAIDARTAISTSAKARRTIE